MLLRRSSTPDFGSLLSQIQEGSNNHETNTTFKHHLPTTTIRHSHSHNKLSCVAFTIPTVSCNSSPISPSFADHKGIRRAHSEGNLQGLPSYAYSKDEEDSCNTNQSSNKKFSRKNKCSMLESIPSFSYHNNLGGQQEDDEGDWEDDDDIEGYLSEKDEKMLQENRGDGERVMVAMEGGGFPMNDVMASMVLNKDVKVMETLWGFERERGMVGQEMHLAKGLGIGGRGGSRGGRGGGGGGKFNSAGSGGDGGHSQRVEEYYKKMIEENPGNPLFLSNYAHFLYQSKQDLPKAEEYYSRAILADPGDGEILSQYAKLVWELHQDKNRAVTYYERAVRASPEDSHVRALYAGFLWETEVDDECEAPSDFNITPQIHQAAVVASANA